MYNDAIQELVEIRVSEQDAAYGPFLIERGHLRSATNCLLSPCIGIPKRSDLYSQEHCTQV